jgi:hypothetical protein
VRYRLHQFFNFKMAVLPAAAISLGTGREVNGRAGKETGCCAGKPPDKNRRSKKNAVLQFFSQLRTRLGGAVFSPVWANSNGS